MESSKQIFCLMQLLKEDTKLMHQAVWQCRFFSPYNTYENPLLFKQESVSFHRSGMGFYNMLQLKFTQIFELYPVLTQKAPTNLSKE